MSTSVVSKFPRISRRRGAIDHDKVERTLATMSARDLLQLFEQSSDVPSMENLRQEWVHQRGRERAAVDLIDVMRRGPARDRVTAFYWLTSITTVAEAAMRVSLRDTNVRPYAIVWLRECGLPGPDPSSDEVRWLYVDLLAVALEDPRRLAASAFRQVAAGGSVDEQVGEVAELWRSDHPQTREVLEMIAHHHPETYVADAARRSLQRVRP